MENLVFLNNLLPDTNEEEIITLLHTNGNLNAQNIHFITYNFMNKLIRLNCAFVSFTDRESAVKFLSPKNPPIEINGHLISLQAATDFIELNPSAILLGDSTYLSKDIILNFLKKYDPIDVNVVYSKDVPYYTIVFNSPENRDNAIQNNRHFMFKRNAYSLRPFGIFPPEKFPIACGINKILEDGSKKKKKKLFLLKHMNQSYYINPIIGAALSGKIRKELALNPKLNELTLLPIKGNFAPINDVFWGKKLVINEKDSDPHFLYHMSSFLQIESLIEFFEDDYYNMLDSENALDEMNDMRKFTSGIAPNIRYLASHLYNFVDVEEFKKLPNDILQLILSSKYICDDQASVAKLTEIISNNQSVSSERKNSNQDMISDEYFNLKLDDYSLDLNTIRYKFIEIFDLGFNQDPNAST